MSLYIVYETDEGVLERQYWVQDLDVSTTRLAVKGTAAGVVKVQADGHELEYIKANFSGIPMANCRVVRWTGDMAKFIVGNL